MCKIAQSYISFYFLPFLNCIPNWTAAVIEGSYASMGGDQAVLLLGKYQSTCRVTNYYCPTITVLFCILPFYLDINLLS